MRLYDFCRLGRRLMDCQNDMTKGTSVLDYGIAADAVAGRAVAVLLPYGGIQVFGLNRL